nr:MBL fold metallo-hydrolase [Kineococcus vitellinus]
MTHIGGPSTLIEVHGWRILTDPTFDAPGRRYSFGWGTGSRKQTGPTRTPDQVGPVDVVLLTHDHHADNLDTLGRRVLERTATVVTTRAGARRLRRSAGRAAGTPDSTPGGGVDGGIGSGVSSGVIGLAPGRSTVLHAPGRTPITVTATPCRHGPRFSRPLAGAVIGFSLAWESQRRGVLWITGDTVLHPALERTARRLHVDTVVLHAGAVRFGLTGPLRYSMDADEAVQLCELLQPRSIVPVHYEGWSHFTQGRDNLRRAFGRTPHLAARVRWLLPAHHGSSAPSQR